MNSAPVLQRMLSDLAALPLAADDASRIDEIRVLEEIKSAVAARQARVTAAFAASQRAAQAVAGVPAARVGHGIARQVGLARRCSPYHAARYVGWATILTSELPATFAALRAGRTTEWRAMLVARETAWLSREHRAAVDRELAPRLERLGDRRVEAETKKAAYRCDPAGYVERIRAAAADRRVTVRPAPDGMSRLTATLPVAQGVACYAALARHADAATAGGDEQARGRGQIMADTLVERITGQAAAPDVPVEIALVMTDQTLLSTGPRRHEPAELLGYGPIPAAIARDLVFGPSERVPRWLRRLYVKPGTDQLVAMESRRRLFPAGQRRYIRLRDQDRCRTPWCEAPIRHINHIRPHVADGPTAIRNGDGECAACNYANQAPGWNASRAADGDIDIISPTGHHYRSRAPDLPSASRDSPSEYRLADFIFLHLPDNAA